MHDYTNVLVNAFKSKNLGTILYVLKNRHDYQFIIMDPRTEAEILFYYWLNSEDFKYITSKTIDMPAWMANVFYQYKIGKKSEK